MSQQNEKSTQKSDNVSSPRTCQQPDEVGVRMTDMGKTCQM